MSGHPWCSDTARDEAIRRSEDAITAERTPLPDHRELPQAVAELRERVGKLEAVTNPRPEATAGSCSVTPGLESAAKLAPAANAGGGSNQEPRGWLSRHERWRLGELVAWLKGRASEHPDTIHGGLCECYAADVEAILARTSEAGVEVGE